MPGCAHVVLPESSTHHRRIIIIGDLHGCSGELQALLDRCYYRRGVDVVISVGDLVNKGPGSIEVLRMVAEHDMHAVRGNHDDAALAAYNEFLAGKAPSKDKLKWVAELSAQEAKVLETLPFSVSLPAYQAVVVHAGMVPGKQIEEQKPEDLLKMRDVVPTPVLEALHTKAAEDESDAEIDALGETAPEFDWEGCLAEALQTTTEKGNDNDKKSDGSNRGLVAQLQGSERRHPAGKAWAGVWRGPPHAFFGHDASRKLQLEKWATGLDGGCVYGGKLYAAVLPPLDEAGVVIEGRAGVPQDAQEIRLGTGMPAWLVSVPAAETIRAQLPFKCIKTIGGSARVGVSAPRLHRSSLVAQSKGLLPSRPSLLGPCRAVEEADWVATENTPVAGGQSDSKPPPKVWRWEDSSDAVRTYAVFLGVLVAGTLPFLQANKFADLPYFISLAVCTIYIGAHRGLNAHHRQQINFKEGLLAPVAASVAIFGAYLLFKYFPDLSLQGFFDAYFWLLGSIATVGAFAGPGRILGSKFNLPVWQVPLPAWLGAVDDDDQPLDKGDISATDILVAVAGIALATADLAAHHGNFTLSNAIACLLAADILQLVGVSSFRVAAVLLFGLLAYDVFWVFGSPMAIGENVMLQVATSDSLVGPTRLIFPRIAGSAGEAASFPFSLLGLGDVAVPGLLACLALRYDASRCVDMRARGMAAAEAIQEAIDSLDPCATGDEIAQTTGDAAIAAYDRIADLELEQRNRTLGQSTTGSSETIYLASDAVLYQRHYFVPVMVAYVLGLGAAFAANAVTGLGQPALLYLVPATLGAVGLVAASRNDLRKVWAYKDTTRAAEEKKES